MLKKYINYLKLFYAKSLHRELLENEIIGIAGQVRGRVLDVGSKNRRYDTTFYNAGSIIAIDLNPLIKENIVKANAINIPFKSGSFDVVISFEVFEYILNIEKVLEEIKRVIMRNGLLIFSAPLLNPVHGDIDVVRYTYRGWEMILSKYFDIIELKSFGGTFTIMWDFYFERVRNAYNNLVKLVVFPILFIAKYIAIYLDGRKQNNRFVMGYLIVCRQKAE